MSCSNFLIALFILIVTTDLSCMEGTLIPATILDSIIQKLESQTPINSKVQALINSEDLKDIHDLQKRREVAQSFLLNQYFMDKLNEGDAFFPGMPPDQLRGILFYHAKTMCGYSTPLETIARHVKPLVQRHLELTELVKSSSSIESTGTSKDQALAHQQALEKSFSDFDSLSDLLNREASAQQEILQLLKKFKHSSVHFTWYDFCISSHSGFELMNYRSNFYYTSLNSLKQLMHFQIDNLTEFYIKQYTPQNNLDKSLKDYLLLAYSDNLSKTQIFTSRLIELALQVTPKTGEINFLKDYFLERLVSLIDYRDQDINPPFKASISAEQDAAINSLKEDSLRSYNVQAEVAASVLSHLRQNAQKNLFATLPKDLTDLIRISKELHPYLKADSAKESTLNYKTAIELGEVTLFLGYAASKPSFGMQLPQQYMRYLPKGKGPFSLPPIPEFLEEKPLQTTPVEAPATQASKKKKKKKPTAAAQQTATQPEELKTANTIPTAEPQTLSNLKMDKPLEETPGDEQPLTPQEPAPAPTFKQLPKVSPAYVEPPLPISPATRVASIIYEIFNPKTCHNIEYNEIIKAWSGVLGKEIGINERTGGSHQPAYIQVDGGPTLRLKLFKSHTGHYGKNFMHEIQEAFTAFGFGLDWLKAQRYRITW